MDATLNTNIIDSYLALLKGLNPNMKQVLISRLTQSLKSDIKTADNLFYSSYGAWAGNETAENIISAIKDSRTFNRQIEEL